MKRQRVLVMGPHIQSQAALVLLGVDYSKAELQIYLDFRHKFMSEFPELVCYYCGKRGLLEETEDRTKLATIDHQVPISKGGAVLDPRNCVISCVPCNQNKKDKV